MATTTKYFQAMLEKIVLVSEQVTRTQQGVVNAKVSVEQGGGAQVSITPGKGGLSRLLIGVEATAVLKNDLGEKLVDAAVKFLGDFKIIDKGGESLSDSLPVPVAAPYMQVVSWHAVRHLQETFGKMGLSTVQLTYLGEFSRSAEEAKPAPRPRRPRPAGRKAAAK